MKIHKKIHTTFSPSSSISKNEPGKAPKKHKCLISIAAFLVMAVIWAIPGCSYSTAPQSAPSISPTMTDSPTSTETIALTDEPAPTITISSSDATDLPDQPTPTEAIVPTEELDPVATSTPVPESTNTSTPEPTPTLLPSDTPTPEPTPTPTIDNTQSNEQTTMVWIPRTGKKYHSSASCSGMKNPSQVSVDEAIRRGFTPCKKCY